MHTRIISNLYQKWASEWHWFVVGSIVRLLYHGDGFCSLFFYGNLSLSFVCHFVKCKIIYNKIYFSRRLDISWKCLWISAPYILLLWSYGLKLAAQLFIFYFCLFFTFNWCARTYIHLYIRTKLLFFVICCRRRRRRCCCLLMVFFYLFIFILCFIFAVRFIGSRISRSFRLRFTKV